MQKFLASVVLELAFFVAGSTFANTSFAKQKVVYHVNYFDVKKSNGAMRNAQNHINALGENHENRFVLGNEVELLGKLLKRARMRQTTLILRSQREIQYLHKYPKGTEDCFDDLHFAEEGDIVPSGVAEIGKLQQYGCVYLRP